MKSLPELIDRLEKEADRVVRMNLLYMWVKSDAIDLRTFRSLFQFV